MVELKVSSIGQVSDETFSVTLDEVAADGSVVRSITVEFPWDMKPAEVKALIIANYERKLAEETNCKTPFRFEKSL